MFSGVQISLSQLRVRTPHKFRDTSCFPCHCRAAQQLSRMPCFQVHAHTNFNIKSTLNDASVCNIFWLSLPSMSCSRLYLHQTLLLLLLLPLVLYLLPLASAGHVLKVVGQSDDNSIARAPQFLGLWNYTVAKVATLFSPQPTGAVACL